MNKLTMYAVALPLAAFFIAPMVSSAQSIQSMTSAQLQAEIQSLTAEVRSLEQQLAVAQGGSTTQWCYTLNTNLSIGMSDAQVTALQTALQKDGESVNIDGIFDGQTATAVVNFQQKYSPQILVPNGLQSGTGYVGPSTRAELNLLFGCSATPTPAPVSTSTLIGISPIVVSPPPIICPAWGCNGPEPIVQPITIVAPTSTPTSTIPVSTSTPSTPTLSAPTSTKVTPLGATTDRIKSPTDRLGTLSLAVNGYGGATVNKITVTFSGSMLNVGSSTFLNGVQLLDLHNVSVTSEDGATASVDPSAGTVTWTFGAGTAGYYIPNGGAYPFTVVVDSAAVPSLGSNIVESLHATIQNASDIQYSDPGGASFGLPPLSVPLTINSVAYLAGE